MAQPTAVLLPGPTDPSAPTKVGPVCERRTLMTFVALPTPGSAPAQVAIAVSVRALRAKNLSLGQGTSIQGGGSFFAIPANGHPFGPFPVDRGEQLYAVSTAPGVVLSAWVYAEYAEEERGEVVQPPMIGTPPAFPQAGENESPGAHKPPRVTAVPTTPAASPNGVAPHHTGVVRPRASGIQ